MSHNLFAPVDVAIRSVADGGLVLSNRMPLPAFEETLVDRLARWGREVPERIFLSDISDDEAEEDDRREYTYAQVDRLVSAMARRFLRRGIGRDNPPMIIAQNSVAHAVAILGAMRAGCAAAIIPPSAVAPGARPFEKFRQMLAAIRPGVILSDAPSLCVSALGQVGETGIEVEQLGLPEPETEQVGVDLVQCRADDIGKFLFTSGSTGVPKAVPQTQRMMVSNMQALGEVWPFLRNVPPVMVDWLPWSHVFGGNFCFNLALYFGGSMHIDHGNPTPDFIHRTIAALERNSPNVYFNVPVGYAALSDILEQRDDLAERFFSQLRFLFNAGAAMPAPLRSQLERLALRWSTTCPPVVGAWGATETAPASTAIYFESSHAGNLGLPLPGTEIRMVPDGDGYELRVRGPNVMNGYWRDEEASSLAFDEEGFFKIGDRAKFAVPDKPEAGLVFDGRLAENFKMLSGTWVNVGDLRLRLVEAGKPLIRDVVLAGEGREALAALVFLSESACRDYLAQKGAAAGSLENPSASDEIQSAVAELLRAHNANNRASSRMIAFFRIQDEEPSITQNEITEKGYINQRAVLRRRTAEVEAAYAGQPL